MKCPFCNFLNSNTRDYCLRCNADLTELKLEFGLSQTIPDDFSEKDENLKGTDLLKAPLPKIIPKTSSHSQIASLQSRISTLKSGSPLNTEETKSSVPQDSIIKDENTVFEDNTTESTLTKAEVKTLISDTAKIPSSAFTPTDPDEEFQVRCLNISYEIEKRMEHWRKILDPKIEASYNELMESFPSHSEEFELGQHTQLSKKKKSEIEQLYELQLKELGGNRNIKRDYQQSHTRSLKRDKLDQTYKGLKTDLLTAKDNIGEEESVAEIDSLPVPDLKTILFSATIDFFVAVISAATFIAMLPIVKNKLFDLDSISKSILASLEVTSPATFIITMIITWFTLSFFFTIFNHGSVGQSIMGLRISTLNGNIPNFSSLFKRFFAQIFNILTLGLRLILQLKSKDGLSCKFSNTRLTFSAFIQ